MSEAFFEGVELGVRLMALLAFLVLAPAMWVTMDVMRDYYEMKIEQEKSNGTDT